MLRVGERTRAPQSPRAAAGPSPAAPARGSELLDRVVAGFPESAWLYVLIATPLTFSIGLTRNFDLPKTVYFRGAMALVVVVAVLAYALGPWLRTEPVLARWRQRTRLGPAALAAALMVLG